MIGQNAFVEHFFGFADLVAGSQPERLPPIRPSLPSVRTDATSGVAGSASGTLGTRSGGSILFRIVSPIGFRVRLGFESSALQNGVRLD